MTAFEVISSHAESTVWRKVDSVKYGDSLLCTVDQTRVRDLESCTLALVAFLRLRCA